MITRQPHTSKLSVVATLFALTAALSGCAQGFHAPGVLQSESGPGDADKNAPSDSLGQVQRNTDPTQKDDPVLSQASTRNTGYKLPDNSYETIRVRLIPVTSSHPGDTMSNSENVDTVTLSNDIGLVVKDLSNLKTRVLTSKKVVITFSKKQLLVDGKSYSFSAASEIGVFPTTAEPSGVSLNYSAARLRAAGIAPPTTGQLQFRGVFVARPQAANSSRWMLVNYVSLEDYVRAVVPSEMGAKSPAEALKAQALATRTYALRQMVVARCTGTSAKCSPRQWDVDPSTQYQSFIGSLAENYTTFDAIEATKNQIIGYQGAPILSMFHASSGGETESAKDHFCKNKAAKEKTKCESSESANFPYLTDLKDPYNGKLARYGHGVGLPQRSAQEMAKEGKVATDIIALYYPGSIIESIDLAK